MRDRPRSACCVRWSAPPDGAATTQTRPSSAASQSAWPGPAGLISAGPILELGETAHRERSKTGHLICSLLGIGRVPLKVRQRRLRRRASSAHDAPKARAEPPFQASTRRTSRPRRAATSRSPSSRVAHQSSTSQSSVRQDQWEVAGEEGACAPLTHSSTRSLCSRTVRPWNPRKWCKPAISRGTCTRSFRLPSLRNTESSASSTSGA